MHVAIPKSGSPICQYIKSLLLFLITEIARQIADNKENMFPIIRCVCIKFTSFFIFYLDKFTISRIFINSPIISLKRDFLRLILSDFFTDEKNIAFSITKPFDKLLRTAQINKWCALLCDYRTTSLFGIFYCNMFLPLLYALFVPV